MQTLQVIHCLDLCLFERVPKFFFPLVSRRESKMIVEAIVHDDLPDQTRCQRPEAMAHSAASLCSWGRCSSVSLSMVNPYIGRGFDVFMVSERDSFMSFTSGFWTVWGRPDRLETTRPLRILFPTLLLASHSLRYGALLPYHEGQAESVPLFGGIPAHLLLPFSRSYKRCISIRRHIFG